MKQLTIEHLSPYLPYGLLIKTSNSDGQFSGNMLYGFKKNGYGVDFFQCSEGKWWRLDQLTPYLRPLNHLTKEITHNGETFVPIMRLLGGEDYSEYNYSIQIDDQSMYGRRIIVSVAGLGKDIISVSLSNFKNNKIFSLGDWKKLYEWHFDLENLIDAGLALPIND